MSSTHSDAEALAERVAVETRKWLPADMAEEVEVRRDLEGAYDEWVIVSAYEKVATGDNRRRLASTGRLSADREVDVELVARKLAEDVKQELERRRNATARVSG